MNLYAEKNPEGSKYPYSIYNTEGYIEWADLGSVKPIQGMMKMNGLLFVVTGNEVFKIDENGSETSLGSITISSTEERVMMAHNKTQVSILTDDGTMWVATASTLVKVTDVDFPSAGSVTTLGGYTIVSKKDTGEFYISALLDSTSWDALDFATAEEQPDDLVRVFAFNGSLWLLGVKSYEIYYKSGNADFPFEQISGAVNTTRGCAAKFSVVEEDNSLFFLGDDKIVYRAIGFSIERVSTHGIETVFTSYSIVSDMFGFVTNVDGHKFYVLTSPSESKTRAYDISSGLWHERTTLIGANAARWSANAYASFADKQLIGHDADGKIYELSPTTYTEAGTTIEKEVRGAVQWKDGERITYDRVRLDIDAGVGLITGQGSDPQVMMSHSDDGCKTFSNEKWRSFGKIGEYSNRAIWRRVGTARERIFRFRITDPVPVRITGAYADGRIGTA